VLFRSLTAALITAPLNASSFLLNPDGSFDYTHDGGETIADSFVYEAADGFGGLTQGTASITVTPVNDPPVVTNPGPQSDADTDAVNLPIVAADAELDILQYTAINLPPGLTIDLFSGVISGLIDCAASVGSPYNVTVDVDDQGLLGVTQIAFTWTVAIQAAPAAIADLVGTQAKTLNDSDGTTKIALNWTGGPAEVYRIGFGSYPEYDDAGGAAPLAPTDAAQALIDGWTLIVGVTNSGDTDEPLLRDSYYYVGFALSSCGTQAAVSNLAGGVLNYHLGDVTNGVTPGTGDNLVNSSDISALGASYNVNSLDAQYFNYLDVGPTTNNSPDGRPITDDEIEFEDLMMFSLNYNNVSKRAPIQVAKSVNSLTLFTPALSEPGNTIEVPIMMQGDGQIHGLSIPLTWNAAVVRPIGYTPGAFLDDQASPTLCLEAEAGFIDMAIFGSQTAGFTGEGLAVTVTFEVLSLGDAEFGFGDLRVRGDQNQSIEVMAQVSSASSVPTATPTISGLYTNYPNPFNPSTSLSFGIGKAGPVSLRIYGLDGRLVRTIVSQSMTPGTYVEAWNGQNEQGATVASGIYYVRLVAVDHSESRSITLLK